MEQTQRPRIAHPRIAAETWDDLMRFEAQLEASLKDHTAPAPDLHLLCGGHHSQFEYLKPGTRERCPVIRFKTATRERNYKERSLPPSAILACRKLLAFGGGFKVNSNGADDLSYLRIFGSTGIQVLRVLLDAQPGEVVTHYPQSHSHRVTFRDYAYEWGLMVPYAVAKAALGKPMRNPGRGREEAIIMALGHFDMHAHKPDTKGATYIRIGRADYEASLRATFKLVDLDRMRRTTH